MGVPSYNPRNIPNIAQRPNQMLINRTRYSPMATIYSFTETSSPFGYQRAVSGGVDHHYLLYNMWVVYQLPLHCTPLGAILDHTDSGCTLKSHYHTLYLQAAPCNCHHPSSLLHGLRQRGNELVPKSELQ